MGTFFLLIAGSLGLLIVLGRRRPHRWQYRYRVALCACPLSGHHKPTRALHPLGDASGLPLAHGQGWARWAMRSIFARFRYISPDSDRRDPPPSCTLSHHTGILLGSHGGGCAACSLLAKRPPERRSIVTQPCPPSDQPDRSFLRLVVIGELLGVDAPLLLRLAAVMHQCGLRYPVDEAAASQVALVRTRTATLHARQQPGTNGRVRT
jgi:hypothetical protein